jgi:hypothetical protein
LLVYIHTDFDFLHSTNDKYYSCESQCFSIRASQGIAFPYMPSRRREDVDVWLYPFSTLPLQSSGWSASRPGHFTRRRRDPIIIVQDAVSSSGLVSLVPENVAPAPPSHSAFAIPTALSRCTTFNFVLTSVIFVHYVQLLV